MSGISGGSLAGTPISSVIIANASASLTVVCSCLRNHAFIFPDLLLLRNELICLFACAFDGWALSKRNFSRDYKRTAISKQNDMQSRSKTTSVALS